MTIKTKQWIHFESLSYLQFKHQTNFLYLTPPPTPTPQPSLFPTHKYKHTCSQTHTLSLSLSRTRTRSWSHPNRWRRHKQRAKPVATLVPVWRESEAQTCSFCSSQIRFSWSFFTLSSFFKAALSCIMQTQMTFTVHIIHVWGKFTLKKVKKKREFNWEPTAGFNVQCDREVEQMIICVHTT